MKVKVLMVGVLIAGGLVVGYQSQGKQTVSAETKETISSQQEATPMLESSSTTANQASEVLEDVESTMTKESFSSIEESKSSEAIASTASTIKQSESEETTAESTTESTVPASEIPAAVTVQTTLPAAKVEENYQFSVVKNQTTEEFIQSIGKDAQEIAWNEGIYASVMIAQAILETGSGNSKLARPPHHNLFGIKGSYHGKKVSFNTQEDKGNGQLYTIQSAFRQYPSYKESLEDYAALLKKGLCGNPSFYQGTWKDYAGTYQEATKVLTGKYATDTSYDKKLNALIETYQLTSFDQQLEEEHMEKEKLANVIENQPEVQPVNENSTDTSSTNESKKSESTTYQTTQKVQQIQPIPQRPAKQVAGNRIAQ